MIIIYCVLGIGHGLCLSILLRLLKLLSKFTLTVLGLCCMEEGDPRSDLFDRLRMPSSNIRLTSLMKTYSFSFVTVHVFEQTGFTPSFDSRYMGAVSHIPRLPMNKTS